MEDTLALYSGFFNSGEAQNRDKSQFWYGINHFVRLLNNEYPDKKIRLVWNNAVKIGCKDRNKNTPPLYIQNTEREYFDVIKEEMDILKPDIILFLSGSNYDGFIKKSFGQFAPFKIDDAFTTRKISKLEIGCGNNVFRTYHPNTCLSKKKKKAWIVILRQLLKTSNCDK